MQLGYSGEENVMVPKKLRSLFCFNEDKELFRFIKTSALDLKFLRFLIIQASGREKVRLPNEIKKLSSLICLRLCGRVVIPSSISSLKRLSTLEVVGPAPRSILVPASILQMKLLRQLILRSGDIFVESSKGRLNPGEGVEVALPCLETLCVHLLTQYFCNSLKKLSNLKTLSTSFHDGRIMVELLSDGASVMQKLEILKLQHWHSYSIYWPSLDLSGYKNLVKLHLSNSRKEYMITGHSIEFPPNLVNITLVSIIGIDDVVEVLKRLSKLEIIKLKFCRGYNLNFCGENSFLQLQVLELRRVRFKQLVADEVGMPNLYKVIYKPLDVISKPLDGYPQVIPERLRKLMEFNE